MINILVYLKNGSVIRNMLWTGISIFFFIHFYCIASKPFLKCIMFFGWWWNGKQNRSNKYIIYTFWHLGLWKHITTEVKHILGTISSLLPISITMKLLTPRNKDCRYLWLLFNPKMICWRLSIKSSEEIGREARSSDSQ